MFSRLFSIFVIASLACAPRPPEMCDPCVEGRCISSIPTVEPAWQVLSSIDDGERLIELPMELGSGVVPPHQCSDPLTCPREGVGALSCLVDRGNEVWTISYSCNATVADVDARLFREDQAPLDVTVGAVADPQGRVVSVDVFAEAEGVTKSYRLTWSSMGEILRTVASFRVDSSRSVSSLTNTIDFDAQGLPFQVARSDDVNGTMVMEWLERDDSSPPRVVVRRFDLDADDDVDRVERYLYGDDGEISEVVLELPGEEPDFVTVGRCCADVCGQSDVVEIIDPVRL